MSRLVHTSILTGLLVLGGCSPTFNWREWPVEGTPLRAVMPCKPESATRSVPMLASAVELHMLACETGGLQFALAWADVGQADRVPEAQSVWRRASLQTMRVAQPPDDPALDWSVAVGGAVQTQGVQAQGTDPRDRAVQSRTAYFSQGARLYQAAVYGPRLDVEAVDAFFAGLKLPAP